MPKDTRYLPQRHTQPFLLPDDFARRGPTQPQPRTAPVAPSPPAYMGLQESPRAYMSSGQDDRVANANALRNMVQTLPTTPAPSNAMQSQFNRSGRAAVSDARLRAQFGNAAPAVRRHTTQSELDALGAPSPLTREARALLDVISQFEGTDRYGNRGYNTLVGGRQIEDLSRHPREVGITTPDGSSRAFGRYQFIPSTWETAASGAGVQDMSPEAQDRAAWWLAQQIYQRTTGRQLAQDITDQSRWEQIALALGNEWASFPSARRWHSQRSRTVDDFRRSFGDFLGGAVQRDPRTAGEFLGLSRGTREAPRANRNFLQRPRVE